MGSIYQPPPSNVQVAVSYGNGLKITTIIFGVIGFIMWGLSIGFMIGWESTVAELVSCTSGGMSKISTGWYISVPTNAALVYVTARIIFIITSRRFPDQLLLADLHECVARLVAFTVLSLAMWAASLSWLVQDDCEPNVVYHACNYGFVISSAVAGMAGGLWAGESKLQAIAVAARKAAPPPPSQAHYNQAYVHHTGHYR